MAGLQYQIGADVKGFQQGVAQVTKGFTTLEQTSKKAIGSIQANADKGALALGSLSNVARDLPFGFIAIQNNLPLVFDAFGNLTKQAGGLGGALKSVGAALAGPAGVTFLIGAAISGITALIQKYGSLGAAVDALVNSYNQQSQEQQLLNELSKEANKNAADDIARLQLLAAVSADTTNSLENRKEAANELLKVYREYLPNLTQEALLNNQAADAINRAKDALLAKALAAAAEKKLADVGERILNNQLAQIEAVRRFGTAQDDLRKQTEKANKEGLKGREGVNTQTVFFNTLLERAADNLQKVGAEGVALQQEFDTLLKLGTAFAKQAGDSFIPDPKEPKTKAKIDNFGKELQKTLENLRFSPEASFIDAIDELNALQKSINVPIKIEPPTPEEIRAATGIGFSEVPIPITVQVNDQATTNLLNRIKEIRLATEQFNQQLTETLRNGLSNLFSSVGEGIGQIISGVGNGFSAAQLVLTSIADILINVGKLAISTGVAISGIKKALQSLNPAVAIAGGVALVALGTAVKGRIANQVPKFAEGGIVTRPTAGVFGEAGPEAIMPLDKLNNMIGNMGGGGNVQVSGRFELQGDKLYALLERTAQRQGRVFR